MYEPNGGHVPGTPPSGSPMVYHFITFTKYISIKVLTLGITNQCTEKITLIFIGATE